MASVPQTIRLGTRGSALARWQTDWVLARLREQWPGLTGEIRLFTTTGDRLIDQPLPAIAGKGVFTEELELALLSGEIDLAVHSLKDLPVRLPPGLALGAICEREDARDVLICPAGAALHALPTGARLGTSSMRRAAQLRRVRPDLTIQPIRGNVDTRLRKAHAGAYDAIVLAAAGVLRLGLEAEITEYLSFDVMLPAPGQAALAVQCRAAEAPMQALLAPIDHGPTRSAVEAERSFLEALGGGCAAPVAALAETAPGNGLSLRGFAGAPDGSASMLLNGVDADPRTLGIRLAQEALAKGAATWL